MISFASTILVKKRLRFFAALWLMLFAFTGDAYTQYTQTICSGSPLTFHNPSAPYPATQYSWSAPTVTGSVTGASPGTNQIEISATLTNSGSTPATVFYNVTAGVNSFTLTVTVDPMPVLSSAVTTTNMCSGGTFSYTATSAVAGTAFSWNRPSVTGISPGTANASNANISEALTNSTGSQRTATYTFTLSAGVCVNTENVSVNVNPTPALTSTLTPADVCSGSLVSYTPLSAQTPVTFSWSRAVVAGITNGAGTGTGNISEMLTNNTAASVAASYVYTLTHTSTGCTNTQTVTLNIKPTPTLTSGTSFSRCSGTAFTYTPTSSLASTSYNWNRATVPNINPGGTFGTGNVNETLTNTSGSAATATYSYSLTAGGCTTNNQDVTVTVNPLPTLSSTLAAGSVCSGNTFHYTPASVQSPSVTFAWSRATVAGISNAAATGTNDPNETLVNTTNAAVPVLYEYTLTNTSSTCTNLEVVTVNVNPIPTISNRAISICNHQGFTDIPPTAPIGTTYTWTTPTVTVGTITNTLNAQAVAQPVVSETVLHNGTASNATVEYVVTPSLGGCSGPSYTLTVTVGTGALPTIDLASLINPPGICSGTAFSYTPLSNSSPTSFDFQRLAVTGISNPASSGNITPGNSILETLVNTTTLPVTTYYYITVNAGGCSNSFTVNTIVNPTPQLSSTLAPAAVCSNTAFTYSPTSAVASTSQYNWQRPTVAGISNAIGSGSGNINETLINTTTASVSVNYNFTLLTSATPSCTFSQTVTVIVSPTPTLSSATSIAAICSGAAASYTATSATGGTLFSWTRAVAASINEPASAGFNPINEVLTNTSLVPGTANYIISLTAAGCTNQQTVTVAVNPVPTVTNQTAIICSGNSFTVTPGGGISGTQYTWSAPVSTPGGVVTGGLTGTLQNNISGTLSNASTAAGVASYTVTPVANGCSGAGFAVDVTVNPRPSISNITIPAVCSGTAFLYTPPSIPSGTIYDWGVPVYTPATLSGGSAQVAQASITQTLANSSLLQASADYTVTPSFAGCAGSSFQLSVPVNPVPQVSAQVTSVCSGNTFSITPAGTPAGTTYTWGTPVSTPLGSVAGVSANAAPVSAISQLVSTSSAVPVQTTYTVVPVSGTCGGAAFTATVTVNPATSLSSTLTPGGICSNTSFSYTPTSNTPSTNAFNWTRAVIAGISNSSGAGSGNPNETLVNTTGAPVGVTYIYSLSTSAGCTNTQNVTVTVNPTPVLTNNPSTTSVCSGSIFNYTPAANTGGSTTFNWARNAVTGISNPATSGSNDPAETLLNTSINIVPVTYAYTLSAFGCSQSENVIVNVNPLPVVGTQTKNICSGTAFIVDNTGLPSGTAFSWPNPISVPSSVVTGGLSGTLQTSVSQTLANITAAPGILNYTVTPIANGCSGSTFSITVTVKPVPNATNATLAAVCSGNAFSYTPPSMPSGTQYSWSVPSVTGILSGGSAQSLQSIISQVLASSNNIANTAVYDVTPVANGCTGNMFQVTVPVNPVPVVNAIARTVCSGVNFDATPATAVPAGTTYTWTAPNPAASTPSGSLTGFTGGTALSVISQTLTSNIYTAAQAVYSVVPAAGSCAGNAFSITVDVNPGTALSSTLTPAAICSNTPFSYAYASNTPSTQFAWSRAAVTGISNLAASGSNDPLETLVNTTASPVTVSYVYILSTPAGCTRTQTVNVVVNPTPRLTSTLTPAAICSSNPFSYAPVTSTGGGTTVNWSRAAVTSISNAAANGTSDPNESLINTSLNIIPVQYVYTLAYSGCTNNETVTVNINPVPVVTGKTDQICSNTAFTIIPTGVPSGTQYSWPAPVSTPAGAISNGSAQTLQGAISQLLTNPGINPATLNYTVTPIANGCAGSTFSVTVTVKPVPVAADFSLAAVCSGTPFSYTPASMPAGTTYSWGIPVLNPAQGITGGSAQVNQTAISQALVSSNNIANTAVYDVIPSTNGCTGNLFHVTVPVNPVPVVSDQSVSICSGTSFTVTPANVPTGTTYTWVMPVYTPAGSVSGGAPEPTPQLSISQFLSHGNTVAVQAQYTVTPATGACPGNAFKVTVGINPGTQMNMSTVAPDICSKSIFSYAAGSNTPGTAFQWTRAAISGISNPAGAGAGNPLEPLYNITSQAISVTYLYTLTTPAGCTKTETVKVQVNPTPELSSSLHPSAICSGSVLHYTPASTMGGTSYTWVRNAVANISNNAATGSGDPSEQLVNTSLANVDVLYQYTLTANSCSNTQTVTVAVNPTPAVSNTIAVTCSNTAFAITPANVPAGTIYTWTAPVVSPVNAVTGAAAQATGQADISQLLLNQTVTLATVRYTVTATAGTCSSAPFLVDVSVKPVATIANQTLNAICSGTAFDFMPANVPSGTTYTWTNPIISPANGLTGGGPEAINKLSISQTLSSINNLVNTATYTVTPLTNGCTGTPFALTVRVNPTPSVANIRDTVCTGNPVSIAPSPVPANTAYTWGNPSYFPFGSLFGGTAQVSPAPTFSQTLINTTTTTALAVYTVRPVADNCTGNDFTVTVVVGAGLNTIPNQVASVCSGVAFDATPVNQPAGTGYTWAAPVVTPGGSLMGHSAASTQQARISQLLDNLTGSDATAVYTVSAYNNGCTSNNFTATVTIMPVPRITVSGSQEICRYPSDTLSLRFTGQAPWGFTYTDDANVQHTINGISNAPFRLAIPATQADTRTLSFLKVTHGGGCANLDDTVYFSQIIHSLPVGTLHSQRGIYICNNIPDTLFVTSPDSVGYQWRFNSVDIPGAADDSLVTNMGGRYNVMLTNRFGCHDTAAVQTALIYIPQPVLRLTYDTYCINTLMNFTNITDTNLTGPTQWLWSFDNGTTAGTFHSSTTFTTGGDHHIQLKASQLYCPAVSTTLDTTVNIRFPIDGVTMPSMWAYKGVSNPISARSLPGYRYRWNPPYGINRPDSANTFFNLQNTQQYVIDLISPAGCVTKDSLLVRVYEDKLVDILVPKSFTPNGDGINDILYPYLTGIKEFKYFKVYNRFNQLMFETTNYDVGWNGTRAGIAQPMAIYIWVAVGVATDGSMVEKKGQVLLLR